MTCPSVGEARSMGLSAINEKLAASVDYWAIGSIYPWQGVIEDTEQYMLMLTTEKNIAEKLMKFIGGLHPYSAPMIVRMDSALAHPNFSFWIDTTLSNTQEYITEEEAILELREEEEEKFPLE